MKSADPYPVIPAGIAGICRRQGWQKPRALSHDWAAGQPITTQHSTTTLHGTDQDGSDLDLLIDALPGATLLDLGDLADELKSLLGIDVDLLTPGDLPPQFRDKVLAEAQPV